MLLGQDPPRTQADLYFRLAGIPVRVHPFFWLIALVLGARSENARDLVGWIVALFVSILIHELGHALMMRSFGFQPSITLYSLGGFASYGDTYGGRRISTGRQILISLAGPGAGFLLAGAIIAALVLTGHEVAFFRHGIELPWVSIEEVGSPDFTQFIFQMLFINIVWGMVNLMPVYPLDGGHISREIFLAVNSRDGIRQSLILSMITAIALGAYGLLQWRSFFMAFLFGYLAYESYTILQRYTNQRGW